MKYYAVICVLLITAVLIVDVLRRQKSRNQVNAFVYKISSRYRAGEITAVVVLVILSVGSLISYFQSHWIVSLANTYIFLIAGIQSSFRAFERYYICDTGVWYSARLFKWDEIKSVQFAHDGPYFIMRAKKLLDMGDGVNFILSEDIREEAISYLASHIKSVA